MFIKVGRHASLDNQQASRLDFGCVEHAICDNSIREGHYFRYWQQVEFATWW